MPVPQERGFFGSLNTIRVLTESTCADKWDILIETALPAAGNALYMLIIPDPDEILENYLQPRGRRGTAKRAKQGFGRRQGTRWGQLRWWQKIGFPDVDQIIADILPGRDFFAGRQAGAPERWIWRGIDILDRGLWYWMLLDLSANFVVEWGSGIMESRFCTSPMGALFSGFGSLATNFSSSPFWLDADDVVVGTNLNWVIHNDSSIERSNPDIPVRGTVVAHVTLTLTNQFPGRSTNIRLRVVITSDDGQGGELLTDYMEVQSGGSLELSVSGFFESFRKVAFATQTEPGKPGFNVAESKWDVTVFAEDL